MPTDPHEPEIPPLLPEAEGGVYPSLEELAHLLPQYEVHEVIGVGGMGAVYKGRQMALDRWVAIKVLPIEASQNTEDTQRFITEARAMAKLMHPHIVAVFDFGQTYQRHLFLVMEYVEGLDLHLRTRAGEVTPKRAREVIAQLCDALQFAHDHGVAHRDIKPANILITNDWKVKVADFGLARDLAAQPNADEPEYGTPDYTAPERLVVGAVVDHRADIYALGVVIHEMLTGKTPAAAGAEAGKGLPDGFAGVINKCLMTDPDRRYQKANDVKIALLTATAEKAIKTDTIRHKESAQTYQVPKEFAGYEPSALAGFKHGLGIVGWAVACLALVCAFAWLLLKDKVSLEPAQAEVAQATPAPVKPEVQPAPAELTATPAPTDKPAQPSATTTMATPKVTQEMEDPTLAPKDLPKAEPFTVADGPAGEVARLKGHESAVYDLDLLQDQHRVVSVGMDGTLRVWDLPTQKEVLQVNPAMGQLPRLQVDSDDSQALIYSYAEDRLAMVDLTTGKITHQAKYPDNYLANAIFMTETKSVLVGGSHKDGTNNLFLWNPAAGDELKPVEGFVGRPYAMVLGQDGKSVIINASQLIEGEKEKYNPVTSLYSAETGQLAVMNVGNLGYITRFYEVRGATHLIIQGNPNKLISRADLSITMSLPLIKPSEPYPLTGQVVDGGRLALTAWTDSTLRVYLVSTGEEIWKEQTPEPVTDMSLSKDQRWGVFSTRYKDTQKQSEGDFDLLVWRMPRWTELQSQSVLTANVESQMADLATHDPELASMRENLMASFPPPNQVEFAAQKQKLDVLYVGALRRQMPGLAPTEQNGVKLEIEGISSGSPLPKKELDTALSPAMQRLRGIYRDQLQALIDKETQANAKTAQTVEGYLLPIKQKREAANDRLGAGRVTALLDKWKLTSVHPVTDDSAATPAGKSVQVATPTKRPDRAGNVIAIQRMAQNTNPMMPPPEAGRVPRDLGPVVALTGGSDHIIALLADGKLKAWGNWQADPLAIPAEAKDVVQIDSTDSSAVALRADGAVVCWGPYTAKTGTTWTPPAGKVPLQVYAGSGSTGYVQCVDGTIEPIGRITPEAPATLGAVAKLQYISATGGWCALLRNGGVAVYWGTEQPPVIPLPADMRDLVSIAISSGYGVALQKDGTMTGWGQLAQDQRFRVRKFTGGTKIYLDHAGRLFPVHRTDHSWELAPNPNIPEYVAEDRTGVVEGRLRSCIDAIFTKEYVIALKP